MKLAGICFTTDGKKIALDVRRILEDFYNSDKVEQQWYGKGKYLEGEDDSPILDVKEPVQEWAGARFQECDVMIFIGAAGIAVRSIAPFVRDKRTDPAVLVIDEKGKFCISLLSGHIGGANALVTELSERMGSTPVITTATDVSHRFAVDVYATENNMIISNMTYAKEVSAALLAGEPVGFYTHFPVEGDLPDGVFWSDKLEEARLARAENEAEGTSLGIYISPSYNRAYFDHTLWLIPKCLVLGIGCKKGTSAAVIEKLVADTLREYSLYPEAIAAVASVDLKKDEPGLLRFCDTHFLPFYTYTADELAKAEGDYTASGFVQQILGVDNVCERAAVLAGGNNLVIRKTSRDGVTLAAVLTKSTIRF